MPPKSHSIIFSDFRSNWYKYWAKELKQDEKHRGMFMLHSNKFWQNAIIAEILKRRKLLKDGCRGIGFGVGKERLPAIFAKNGVEVTATDQDFRGIGAYHWKENELAQEITDLNELGICPPKKFKRNVSLLALDMNKLPEKYHGKYDFVWTNCSLGHLGSIEAGLNFIVNSAKYLKSDGCAVHTTEINVLSDSSTVEIGDTVIFRPKDILLLQEKLSVIGCILEPMTLTLANGTTKMDGRISMSPEFGTDFTKIQVGGHLATQVVLIVSKQQKLIKPRAAVNKHQSRIKYKKNIKQQNKFINTNPFIGAIKESENYAFTPGSITPVRNNMRLKLTDKPKSTYCEFKNNTKYPLFSVNKKLYTTKPILVSTDSPIDRNSRFAAKDWHGSQKNRPSKYLFSKRNGKWHEISHVKSFDRFAFRVTLDPKNLKKGNYIERFSLVHEGVKHLEGTEITLNIKIQ